MVELKFATEVIIIILISIKEMFFARSEWIGWRRPAAAMFMSMCSSKGEKYYEVVKY